MPRNSNFQNQKRKKKKKKLQNCKINEFNKQINKHVPLPMRQQRDHQRSQDYSQLDN